MIHIWGPVMVIPFCGPDEALQALDLIGRDPSARQVSVVVVDLSGAIVDEAFGAVALEQLIEGVDAHRRRGRLRRRRRALGGSGRGPVDASAAGR